MKERRGNAPAAPPTGPAALATWLHDQLTARGYDLSGERSGGKTQAADDSGISRSSISRLLNGIPVTDIDVYRRLAQWLEHPFGDILVRAGKMDATDLVAPPDDTHMTPERAADGLGLRGRDRELFLLNANAILNRTPPAD
jgi:transcriptional regulator with XRE-family HTH domain